MTVTVEVIDESAARVMYRNSQETLERAGTSFQREQVRNAVDIVAALASAVISSAVPDSRGRPKEQKSARFTVNITVL